MTKPLAIALVLPLLLCGRGAAQDVQPASDLPTRVRAIFLAKCSECHGRSLSRPRAALYLHELSQVARNPEWVVPYAPEKSYLWTLLQNDDMPAKGAKVGPLTAEEKETVRAWIAAGAPVPASQAVPPSQPPPPVTPDAEPAPPRPWPARLLAWIGKFHVLVIHFPIALLAAAALAELLAWWRGSVLPDPTVRYCVLLGCAGAVAAAALGWLHADVGGHGSAAGGVLLVHRYLGTTAAVWAIGMVWLSERDTRKARPGLLFRAVLWNGALLVALAAHCGGLLVYGNQFFEW
jgi:uncharacterized membrane protein